MVDPRHLADIRAGTPAECLRSGSGYRIGSRLVLTARHVLTDDTGQVLPVVQVWLGHPRDGAPTLHQAEVVDWRPPGGQDVALLRLIDDAGDYGLPLRWGRATGSERIAYTGLGFPAFAEYIPGKRGVEQLSGAVSPLSTGPNGCYPLDQIAHPEPAPPPRPSATSGDGQARPRRWSGVSGAAVFSDGLTSGGTGEGEARLLIGVATADDAVFADRRLHATAVQDFFHDPAFAALLHADTGMQPVMESVELHPLFRPQQHEPLAGTPGSLLVAGREIVGFHGREDLLGELEQWRQGPERFSLKLITGEGGQGKTRLAREFVQRCPADWVAGFADIPHPSRHHDHDEHDGRPQTGLDAQMLARLIGSEVPVLVVADYAEAAPNRIGALLELLLRRPPRRPVRLLLLARSAQQWWDNLRTQLEQDHPAALAAPVQLAPLAAPADGLGGRQAAFDRAADAFAAHLDAFPELPAADWPRLAHQVRTAGPDLAGERFGNALTLHMTALNALLRAATGQDPSLLTDPEQELAGHERRYLYRVARRQGLLKAGVLSARTDPDRRAAESQRALDRALAAAILLGPCDTRRASAVAGMAGQAYAQDVADWLATLYPPSDDDHAGGTRIAAIQPDRLAERLSGQILNEQPDALPQITSILGDHDLDTARNCLTVLARAAARPAFGVVLDAQVQQVIVARPQPYAIAAQITALSVDRPDPLVQGLLALARQDPEQFTIQIAQVADSLPRASLSLVWLALDVSSLHAALFDSLTEANPDAYLPDLAASLNNLAIRLGEAGRREEGLRTTQRATEAYEHLAEANPDAYLPDLAMSLNNLAVDLGEAGRRKEGLRTAQRAAEAYERLAEANPDAYLPDLAASLNNLAIRLGEAGRREEGLRTAQRATEAYERLAEANPDAYLPYLAASLNNLAVDLAEAGRRKEGLRTAQRAAEAYERLAEANPDAYLPDLAMSLNNLAIRLGEAGRHEEGLRTAQRATEAYERLAEANPDAYLPDLAASLNNLAIRLGEAGRHEEGLRTAQRAAEAYERLAEANPDAYLPDLAMSLNNLAIRLAETGRHEEGLRTAQRAVDIREQLAEANPDAYLPYLAASLNNLANRLGEAGRREEGLRTTQRATEAYEHLAEANPDAYLPDLAASLNNLAIRLGEAGRHEEGLRTAQRATELRQELVARHPGLFEKELARSLINWGVQQLGAGKIRQAIDPLLQAMLLCSEHGHEDLLRVAASVLREAAGWEAAAVAAEFERLTGEPMPEWLQPGD
ncbi:tetratricopeptide repeat protein [Nonomuraea wenchangensis]